MKKIITPEAYILPKEKLEKLTDKQIKKLFDYWISLSEYRNIKNTKMIYIDCDNGVQYPLPQMNIDDMIEFLNKYGKNSEVNNVLNDLWEMIRSLL